MAHSDVVSVTIVTYNSGRFIKRCLESVLTQRYPFKELIVVDNASTDGTIDILEQFEDRCQIYYNDENVGFAAAQNQAIKLSAYSSTAGWVAGIFYLIPALWILAIIGGLYSLYLFWVGLPVMMKVPAEKAVPYIVVIVIATIVFYWITAFIAGRMMYM